MATKRRKPRKTRQTRAQRAASLRNLKKARAAVRRRTTKRRTRRRHLRRPLAMPQPDTLATIRTLAALAARQEDPAAVRALAAEIADAAAKLEAEPETPPPTWKARVLGVLPDVLGVALFGTLALLRVISPEAAGGWILAILAGRLYPRRPPPDGPAGGAPPSGVVTLALAGLGGVTWLARRASGALPMTGYVLPARNPYPRALGWTDTPAAAPSLRADGNTVDPALVTLTGPYYAPVREVGVFSSPGDRILCTWGFSAAITVSAPDMWIDWRLMDTSGVPFQRCAGYTNKQTAVDAYLSGGGSLWIIAPAGTFVKARIDMRASAGEAAIDTATQASFASLALINLGPPPLAVRAPANPGVPRRSPWRKDATAREARNLRKAPRDAQIVAFLVRGR
jgi:hypothetical protein